MSNLPPAARKQAAAAAKIQAEQAAARRGEAAPQPAAPPPPAQGVHLQPVTEFVPGQEPPLEVAPQSQIPPASATDPSQAPVNTPDYKQRYQVLQGKYNSEVPALREQVNFLMTQTQQLMNQRQMPAPVQQPAAPAPLRGVTPEEIQEYGSELLDVVRRVAAQEVAPHLQRVEGAVQNAQTTAANAAARAAEQARVAVYESLSAFDDNWELINNSDEFLAWLAVKDVISGQTRRMGLMNAFETNDAARVVAIFKTFKEEDSRSRSTARVPTVDPATLIAPGQPAGGAPAAPANNAGKIWSEEEIGAFQARVRKGRVTADERTRIEADIMAAVREGRVRPTHSTAHLANAAG